MDFYFIFVQFRKNIILIERITYIRPLKQTICCMINRIIGIILIGGLFLPINLQAQWLTDTLRVGVKTSPPFLIKNESGDFEGINMFLWEKIASDLDLSYSIKEMSLEELITGLENNEIDVAINPLTVTSNRFKRIDFSHPFYVSYTSMATQRKGSLNVITGFISSFFSINFLRALLLLFLIILVFGLLVWLFERKKNPDEFQKGLPGIWSGIWWSAVTMTTVGYGDKSPQSLGGRIIALVWMFTAIIVISGFTASIASALTVNQLGTSIDAIDDLRNIQTGTVAGSASADFLDKNSIAHSTYESLSAGLDRLEAGDVEVIAYDQPILQYTLSKEGRDQLTVLPLTFNQQYYAFGFPKEDLLHPVLKDTISQHLVKITEETSWKVILAEYNLSVE